MQSHQRARYCERKDQRDCSDAIQAGQMKLLDSSAAAWVEIRRISESITCAPRLRELGILDGASIYMIRNSDPLLLLVGDTRIAIDRETAAGIIVTGNNLDD